MSDLLVPLDRGLGTAYERFCFYQVLDTWCARYGVRTLVEGPYDGVAGVRGVHGAGVARRGVAVTSLVPDEAMRATAEGVFRRVGADAAKVEVFSPDAPLAAIPEAEMVVTYHALSIVPDWRAYLHAVGSRATRYVVVAMCNPHNWGVRAVTTIGKLRGMSKLRPPESWYPAVLRPELERLGRVVEHRYFDCPWWPDMHVTPGQSVTDRIRQLVFGARKNVAFNMNDPEAKLAPRFVYGPERWPYFGGEGWSDELAPALLRHPAFEGREGPIAAWMGHLHAFVVERPTA